MQFSPSSFDRQLTADEMAFYQPQFDQAAAQDQFNRQNNISDSQSVWELLSPASQSSSFGGASLQAAQPYQSPNNSGGANFGGSQASNDAPMQNPYLRDQMSALVGQYQQQFLQNTAPQLRANALASGQYGGSRQAIAEGIAQGNAATGLASALSGLQSGTYQTDINNALQSQASRNQYNLGLGQLGLGYGQLQNSANTASQNYNLGLGQLQNSANTANQNYNLGLGQLQNSANTASQNYNLGLGQLGLGYGNLQNNANTANQNFYTSQRGQDLQQYGLGASLANQGLTGQTSVGQGQYNLGNVYQQAPMQALNTYSSALQPYTGYGQSNTTTSNTGGGFSGAMGGALAGMNIGNRIGNYMGGSGGWDPYSGSTGATNSSLMSLYGNGMG